MPSAKRLPVGATDLPSSVGIGLLKVPVMTPVTAVHLPDPQRMGGGVGGFSQADWAFAVRLPPVNSISDKGVKATCFLAMNFSSFARHQLSSGHHSCLRRALRLKQQNDRPLWCHPTVCRKPLRCR